MIPYFAQPTWSFGPFTIHAFGVAVAVALALSYALALYRSREFGIGSTEAGNAFVIGTLSGLSGAWLLAQGRGMSEVGLALGSGLAIGTMAWRRCSWRMMDLFAHVFLCQMIVARTGCFLAHDHIGRLTSNWIGVQFPDGVRFDLGLLYALSALVCAAVVFVISRRQEPLPPGLVFGVSLAFLSITRLLIVRLNDSVRATDEVIAGSLFIAGCGLIAVRWRSRGTRSEGGNSVPSIHRAPTA